MTTILTSVVRKNRNFIVIAESPSGKRSRSAFYDHPSLADHLQVARSLARRIGLPDNLIHGETKQGFAFTPCANPPLSLKDVENAALVLTKAAASMPDEHCDPIRLAAGITDLLKKA